MALTQKRTIQELFRKYYIRPSKKLGQNFLIDKKILEKITKEARLEKNNTVLEIGPGIGNLTQEIAKRVKAVIAIEKDPKMCEILKETLGEFKNVEIIQSDILKVNFQYPISNIQRKSKCQILSNKCQIRHLEIRNFIGNWVLEIGNYKVIANLPFYLTAPVIRKFLESDSPPAEMVLVIQKEVAQRICAKPPNMSILAVSVQFYAKPKIISYISKKSFWPQPNVDAAILKISNIKNQKSKIFRTPDSDGRIRIPRAEGEGCAFRMLFFRIVKAGFSHPRKQLANNLSSGLVLSPPNGLKLEKEKIKSWLLKNKINPERRAETLSLKDWLALTKNCNFFIFFLFVLFCFVV